MYSSDERTDGRYSVITGTYPPHPDYVRSIQVTTFDAQHHLIRRVYGRSLELPEVKVPPKDSCACYGWVFAYDLTTDRFVVTTQ